MCGIAGAFDLSGKPIEQRLLARMRAQIDHRGPDGRDQVADGPVGLVHTRLAILDLSDAAHQPMWLEDRSACLAYNGEIYNFRALRRQLQREGVRFRSSGDTEVLLRACRLWGVRGTLPRLNGMFAFAYWDAAAGELWLARDRNGIKPLYTLRDGDRLLFASEIKALLAASTRAPEPDICSILLLLEGGTPWEPHTAFAGVRALPPAHALRVRCRREPVCHRYFDLFGAIDEDRYRRLQQTPFAQVAGEFAERMRESVRIHSIADAPVAALASGGIDSSLIAALAVQQRPGMPLYHAEVLGPNSEAAFAREVAHFLRCPLVVARLDGDTYRRDLVRTTWFHETPSAYHPNDVPFQVVARRAGRDGIKVLLTGEGADELFLGYGHACKRVLRGRLRQRLERLPAGGAVARLIFAGAGDSVVEALGSRGVRERWAAGAAAAYAFVEDPVERAALVDNALHMRAHLGSLLQRNDRMGMMHGLESRIPFLENAVVEFGVNLPLRHKHPSLLRDFLRGHPMRRNKAVVRAAAERLLPRSIVRRKKRGFPVTPESYLEVGPELLREGFLEGVLRLRHRQMAEAFAALDGDRRWNLFATEIFGRLFFLSEPVEALGERLQGLRRRQAA